MTLYYDVENRIFNLSLTVSFLMHILVLASLFYANVHYERKIPESLEVVYRTEYKDTVDEPPKDADIQSIKNRRGNVKPKILSQKDPQHSPILQSLAKQPVKLKMQKKHFSKLPSLEGKRHIAVPLLRSEKITNPKYLSYHDRIRDKIKNRAYFYVDDPRFDAGEVYLTFVISANGDLKAVKLINKKTYANDYLKSVGLRSIKESSPFPSFPADLKFKYPELSFNVVISFEINE